MTTQERGHLLLLIVASIAFGVGVWALLRFTPVRRPVNPTAEPSSRDAIRSADPDLWARSMEKMKEPRDQTGNVALEIPTELRHYEDRHWFLATQVAEVEKFNVQPVSGLCGSGGDDSARRTGFAACRHRYLHPFRRRRQSRRWRIHPLVGRSQHRTLRRSRTARCLRPARICALEAYKRKYSGLQNQLAALKKGSSARQRELQKEITARQQELKANDEEKACSINLMGNRRAGKDCLRDYESLQALAKNFGGRSFNLDNASDRQALESEYA